jgi:hypothetical protein
MLAVRRFLAIDSHIYGLEPLKKGDAPAGGAKRLIRLSQAFAAPQARLKKVFLPHRRPGSCSSEKQALS